MTNNQLDHFSLGTGYEESVFIAPIEISPPQDS